MPAPPVVPAGLEPRLRAVFAIYRRELASYFDSPLAYIVVPAFLFLVGGFSLYFNDVLAAGVATMRTVFFWSAVFYLLLIPAVTMRLFAEEKRTGSLELLVTMPVDEAQMVLGKYLAALSLMTVALALTVTYPLTLASLSDLDWGPVLGGYLGLFLLGAAFCAIGTAASAFTRNQIVAFLVALLLCVVPYATGFALQQVPAGALTVVQHLSFQTHVEDLARGIVDTRSLVYFGSIVGLFLHLAVFALEHRRLS
ncbi:MAG: ABC transporter permease [Alphaproteobacteria bacterium]|nr:ABC transporter permease [Alphaproteobacteria bacterium]